MKRDAKELALVAALLITTIAQALLTIWMLCGGKLDVLP